jgi:O-succinylhomoserine sulfhydrylase
MNNSEFGFETQAIRNQLERTQYLEHSVPLYLTSSFVFEDAEDMRASFAEEKTGIFTADTATQTTTNLLAKYALWRCCSWFCLASGMAAVYSTLAALLILRSLFLRAVFWCNTLFY